LNIAALDSYLHSNNQWHISGMAGIARDMGASLMGAQ